MKEKFERFKNEKIAVNVRSQKQYGDFMKMCEEQGLQWNSGDLPTKYPTKYNVYNYHKENTCIILNNLKRLTYCDIDFYKNNGYKIITYKDFMKEEPKQFTKSDLKDNHIVIFEGGHKRLWGLFINKDSYKEDLTHKGLKGLNIKEVYEFDKLVWKREEFEFTTKESRERFKVLIKSHYVEIVNENGTNLFHCKNLNILDTEIEIIEEDKLIEKMDEINPNNWCWVAQNKINELIDEVNKLKKESDK